MLFSTLTSCIRSWILKFKYIIFLYLLYYIHTLKKKSVFIHTLCFSSFRPGYNPNERPTTPEKMKKAPPPDRVNMHPIYPMVYKKLLLVTRFKDFPNVILYCTLHILFYCMYVFYLCISCKLWRRTWTSRSTSWKSSSATFPQMDRMDISVSRYRSVHTYMFFKINELNN